MRSICDKIVVKIETHILCSVAFCPQIVPSSLVITRINI